MIRRLEEVSVNAWPCLQSVLYDGWVLRFAQGYTRRANSVNPLYASTLALGDKIVACERLYAHQDLATVFKLTPDTSPPELDQELAARGYRLDAPTSVQTLDLNGALAGPGLPAMLTPSPSEEWLEAYCRMSAVSSQRQATLRQMLGNIVPAHCFAAVLHAERVVACGLGVAQDGFVGLFDIVTDASFRRLGYGRQLIQHLLIWGQDQRAHTAYLQVMANNAPALRLYAGLGFREVYPYWYRTR
jgi:N-acetylglutamate synthase